MPTPFWDELRQAFAAERPSATAFDPAEAFRLLRDDLVHAFEAELHTDERALVADLEARWPRILQAAFADAHRYEALVAKLGDAAASDPAAMNVDLLGLLDRGRHEPTHTRALAGFIKSGEHGRRLLFSLLRAAEPRLEDRRDLASFSVERVDAEREVCVGGSVFIPDIVIDLTSASERLLVVIENKIGIRDREGQLDAYAAWVTSERPAHQCLIYLSPDRAPPSLARTSKWTPVSYGELATAWRGVLRDLHGAWADALRLYLATVMQHVLLRRIPARSPSEQALLVPYLEAAVGPGKDT